MKTLLKRILASLIIIVLGLSIGLGSFFFLIGKEEKKSVEEEEFLGEIKATVLKEDGHGGWVPVSISGEIIDGYINFTCTRNNTQIDTLELFLTNYLPHVVSDPVPENWSLIESYNDDKPSYSYVINSRTLPDEETWYFIIRAVTLETEPKVIFSNYSIPFGISHFNDSISFNYLDIDGRINYNSHIEIIPFGGFEDKIRNLDLYVNYSNDIEFLIILNYTILSSNYWLIDLDLLETWSMVKGLSNNETIINFIIEADFTYGPEFSTYSHNYTLDSIILDTKGPDINVDAGISPFGYVYSDLNNYILTVNITCSDTHFSSIKLEYKYETQEPGMEIWRSIGTYTGNIPFVLIHFNIRNMRDDKIYFRLTGYDDLGNSKVLDNSSYWIIKDMNNHRNFVVEGLDEMYGLDNNNMIDLSLKVFPVDNDITTVMVSTIYEAFQLINVKIIEDHIYFEDAGPEDIKLNHVYYDIFGDVFTYIQVEVKLYQGATLVTSIRKIITVADIIFTDKVEISNIEIDTDHKVNNIWMSFFNGTTAYNNSHGIPYIANSNPPVIQLYNSIGSLTAVVPLHPWCDVNGTEIYNTGSIEIIDNHFILEQPNPLGGEICSIEEIWVNGTKYNFSYLMVIGGYLYIQLLTGDDLDDIYGSSAPIEVKYGISTSVRNTRQFVASFDFSSVPQGDYTIVGEFYDVSGINSSFPLNGTCPIDFEGPYIFKQFNNFDSVNPDTGFISFIINDYSDIDSYFFNISFDDGYWTIDHNLYIYYFNDTTISEGPISIKLTCIDSRGYNNSLEFEIIFDRTPPEITLVYYYDELLISGVFLVNVSINDVSEFDISLKCINANTSVVYRDIVYTVKNTIDDDWQVFFDINQLPDGYYDVYICTEDSAGNYAELMVDTIKNY